MVKLKLVNKLFTFSNVLNFENTLYIRIIILIMYIRIIFMAHQQYLLH